MPNPPPRSPFLLFLVPVAIVIVAVFFLEDASRSMLAESAAGGGVSARDARYAELLNGYLAIRDHVLAHWVLYLFLVVGGFSLLYHGLRAMAAAANRWRERYTGMELRTPEYAIKNPWDRGDLVEAQAAVQDALRDAIETNPDPAAQVVLGIAEDGSPVYIADRARTMHVQCLGQTGSGKTQSVLYPLMLQDILRGRGVVFLDAKGSQDNEEMLARMATAAGRSEEFALFSLAPGRSALTYNPLYLVPGADPRQVAERFFSTVEPTMDNPYYKDKARELVIALVAALASTGKQMIPQDLEACIADPDVMVHALQQASDRAAVREIESAYVQLGRAVGKTYSGLLTAIRRYNHPLLNDYAPDIVLEDVVERGEMVAFSLCANAYKFLARAVGQMVLQHLQQIGAQRQMDRSRSQAPVYVYADEFYNFAYEGFIDGVNKLRDANISMFLAHQDASDLEHVSPEFARGVWANTRNKIVLFQDDPDFCEMLSRAIGSKRGIELTVRRNVDAFLNQASALEASSREVAEFVCHPDAFKALRTGQCYLVQKGLAVPPPARPWWAAWRPLPKRPATAVAAVNLAMIKPEYLPAPAVVPPARRRAADGLGLYELFLANGATAAPSRG